LERYQILTGWWIFELKYDGFRALGYIDSGQCWLVSRRGTAYKSFPQLCAAIGAAIPGQAVLDGEIVHLDAQGKPRFYDLMRRRMPQHYFAFGLLWLASRDLRRYRHRNVDGMAVFMGALRLILLDVLAGRREVIGSRASKVLALGVNPLICIGRSWHLQYWWDWPDRKIIETLHVPAKWWTWNSGQASAPPEHWPLTSTELSRAQERSNGERNVPSRS
jgi:hypothetical protein